MLEKTPDELEDIYGDLAGAITAFLAIREGNASIFATGSLINPVSGEP